MANITMRSLLARRTLRPAMLQSFSSSAFRAVGKESDLHKEGRAQEAEDIKNKQIQKQREGKGEWHPELASDSEETIKADRDHPDKPIEKLQEETAGHAKEKHGH